MERGFGLAQWLLLRACLVLGVAAAALGCKSDCSKQTGEGGGGHCSRLAGRFGDRCADIPPGALPQPLGTFSNEIYNRHAEKGEADHFVIYYNEWLDGEATLGPYGSDHFIRIVARLPEVAYPLILQPEPEKPELNSRRYAALVKALNEAGFADADKRVLVGRSWGEGLFGEESFRVYLPIPGFGNRGNFNGSGGAGFNGFGGYGGFGNFSGGGFNGFGGGGISGFGGVR
jgi:hypothetical protein